MEPYSSDSYVPWLCYADMLRSIDIPRSCYSSASLFFCLRVSSILVDDTSWTHELHLPWEDGDHELSTVSMALASWNCPELLMILPSSSVPTMGSFGYDPRNRDPSGPRNEWPSTLIHTHILTYISPLVACVLYLLSRDQAGFEPLNVGDSWRPRRVKTLKRGRRCGDVPHPY